MSHSSRRQYRLQTRNNALDTKKYYSSRKKKIISIQMTRNNSSIYSMGGFSLFPLIVYFFLIYSACNEFL